MSTSNLKVQITALSLCASAVAIYIHLPYVIAVVSGSGAIEAVPLAIFTVSAVIALASVAHLIKLTVSPQTEMEDKSSVPPSSNNLSLNLTISGSGNVNICTKNDNMLMGAGIPTQEKVSNWQIDEVGTPEDQTNTGKGQPTKDVIKESVLAPKSPPPPPVLGAQTKTSASVPSPPPPPPVLGTQTKTSASVPPPPPPPVLGTQTKTSASVPPPPPPPPVPNKSGEESGHTASQVPQENSVNQGKLNAILSVVAKNDDDGKETYNERVKRLQAERKEMPSVGSLSIAEQIHRELKKGVTLKKVSSQPRPGKESGHTASQVPQEKSVIDASSSSDSSGRSSNVDGAQTNTSASVPPPPLSSNGTPLPKKANSPSDSNVKPDMSAIFNSVRQRSMNKDKRLEEIAKIEEQREKIREKEANAQGDGLLNKMMESTLLERRERIDTSSPPDSNGWSSNGDEEQDKQSFAPAQADAPIGATHEIDSDDELVNFQPDNEKRSKSPDSAYGSKSPSPLDFKSEAEKPQVPASLQEEPSVTKVNNVDPVNSRA